MFWAPSPECDGSAEGQTCAYRVDRDGKVYILWGDAGLHSMELVKGSTTEMSGEKHDGEPCHAVFVKRLRAPQDPTALDHVVEYLGRNRFQASA